MSEGRPIYIVAPFSSCHRFIDNGAMTTVSDIGETALIERLRRQIADARLDEPSQAGFRLQLGIGDDAAAWRFPTGCVEVCTTDTMVEGTHFTQETTPWADVGWKLMAANLSDVAAMGATPLCAVVTIGLPGDLAVHAVDALYDGMLDACRTFGCAIVGGDIVSAPVTFASVTLTGACAAEPLTRTAARPGDVVAVTGPLGASGGGLRAMREGLPGSAAIDALIAAHRRPQPRIAAGLRLLRGGVRCAMDVSDGLVEDLRKLGRASGVGVELATDQVPVATALRAALPDVALALALGGGEDYELVFAGPAVVVERAIAELEGGAIIGRVTPDDPGTVRVLDAGGNEVEVTSAGWEHLR